MTPYRARIRLADEPGRLGLATTALSALGINILDVDVQSDDGVLWVDDLLIDFPFPIDPSTIDAVLHEAGIELVDLRPADSHEVVDSTVHCLDLVHALADGVVTDDDVARVAGSFLRCDLAWITPSPVLALRGAVADAMINGEATQAREWVKVLRGDAGPVWTLAVPFDQSGERRVLSLLRRGPRFSYTESARAAALMRVVASLRPAVRGKPVRSAPAHPQARTVI